MIERSLHEMAQALAGKEISSVELTGLYLERIARHNPLLNAFLTVDAERSLAQARQADERLARGEQTALTGIPIAHKDIFCARDWRTTCGSKMLGNFVSPYDASVIERFQAAGAVLLGKTNMDEFAMGSSNETSFYGPVRNPWDSTCVPGGSSGGSAAAVAARLSPAATGTDTGGSIRQPAALCGLSGMKPTYGVISRYGMIAFASSLDQAGPLARSAADCALLLNTMAGFDERDSTSLDRPPEDYTRELASDGGTQPLRGIRIGLPEEFFAGGCDQEVMQLVEQAIAEYRKLGAETVVLSLPNMRLSVAAYYVIAPAEASSNLARFDGVRYGYRAPEYDDLNEMYSRTRAQGFGAEVKRRILIGTYVLSHGYYDAYYRQAQRIRRLIAQDFAAAFRQCDVIVGPTSPSTAFKLGEKAADPVQMYLSDIYTIAVNLAGLPGLSIPCGFARGLPAGLQLIGNYFSEAKLLNVAHRYQQVTHWHQARPDAFA
ncbi:MAG TPA: Asp-tRNA(Asn)/Glu-tRNA(Gln) amidotransferase subunit GatA [Accumulibacter sp.]|uniref:Asp-tRNA(Asn)/Glu-tRNA(Gln) amidotransferase subunit GatA n=1 Tax=Accumulibacter sp. TaxID=2053492 RepID=UPI00287A00D6|nr:Asp-tRNA(Asn)/Glu-tRNA(Gln) amidotransferase subunit GatA [Accumulibacter sp.]MDS4056813.1 Asp-tRNA(Asn)/Glu-tRNA(Gln) amidotransferase subunit GatA [Accumulibacter sp.]HMV05009.1 Asp-tRNA(Asn)/Glu-tRNA(Gln) amidotransferase subunit GatA [Accumulibacter sp.]HMW62602.1 Asp-tRNA(Asn)/Glu-tRNA(Gln) amidotransferase subunit GatA [Accumulibacter sp.]HMW79794.1 Asp-tRNA(Asn)/Glu-tRNA(Gln) amidotransferase subunit GatA [Accumulibacter sp.]HMX68722.1 Asp-tRNA(Asn)/Glu-tRNA(Gln) amidotransferase sub